RVPDDRVGRVPAAVATEPRPVGQVDVLVHHEERLVEPAELLEHRAPDHERRPARAEHFLGPAVVVGAPAGAALVRAARPYGPVAGAVDDGRVVHPDQPRGDEVAAGPGRERRVEPGEPVAGDDRVVIEKNQASPAGTSRTGVVPGGKAEVTVRLYQLNRGEPIPDERGRPVPRR